MWRYEKRLQYPVKISQTNPKLAQFIISQYGGPDGESAAAMRYLSQRYAMPYKRGKAILTDIGTEELGHWEIIASIVHQLTRNLTPKEIEESGFGPYYIDHTTGIWPQAAGGIPFNACEFQSKGIRLRIFLRIWRQNRKPASPTTTSSASATIRMSTTPSASCGSGRSCISSASAKHYKQKRMDLRFIFSSLF